MTRFAHRARRCLTPAGVLVGLAAALPPANTYARQYAFVQAVQFAIFAIAVPALLAIGRPSGDSRAAGLPPSARAAVRLLPFLALVVAWRLPAVLDALARDSALALAEMVTLVVAGSGIWFELVSLPSARQALTRPRRAAVAAISMWTIWAIAYVTGMSASALPASLRPDALGAATDRQLAAGILWAFPAICFLPVIFTMLMTWLGERDGQGQELATVALPAGEVHSGDVRPRPPRGWR
jgi:cytochrome c oxidase assembly factor CtaG